MRRAGIHRLLVLNSQIHFGREKAVFGPCIPGIEQDAKFNSIFVTACLLANFFSTLCGIIMDKSGIHKPLRLTHRPAGWGPLVDLLDKFGLLCARVFTSIQMTVGLIMMIFYTNRTALEYGAYLIAMSSIGNLLTDITIQVICIVSDLKMKINVQC